MKTKLLILLNGLEIGGAQNMVYELLRCLNREQFDVALVCYGKRRDNSLTSKTEALLPVRYLSSSGKITLRTLRTVFHAIAEFQPDVIHSHLGGNVFAVLWALLHRTRVVITAHTKPEQAFSKSLLPLLKFCLKSNRIRMVAVSKENQRLLCEYFRINHQKCLFVNNGIDLSRYYRKSHERFTFIHVGRQDVNKNQAAILRAFSRIKSGHPDTFLYLVGDGDKRTELSALAQSLGIASGVCFTGNVGNTQDYYALADCYVQSSHREALPLTAIEALASGLPIISTDVGGMRDIVTEGNGILIPDGDEEALYRAMKHILNLSVRERKAMEACSSETARRYDAENMTAAYEQIYQQKVT